MNRLFPLLSILLVFFLFSPSWSFTLPDTGQTEYYTHTPGEDSDYNIYPRSYTKLDASGHELPDAAEDWAMVKDNVSGLVWDVKTEDGSIHDSSNVYSWEDASKIYIKKLNEQSFGGYSDWRLPSVKELTSLINRAKSNPAVNAKYFPHTESSFYWSNTEMPYVKEYSWIVDFASGYVFSYCQKNKYHVRAVRGLPEEKKHDFKDNEDGTVTDFTTRLMWKKIADKKMTWEEALTYCENLNYAGYTDWRLPNINELISLVDYSQNDPCIAGSFFPDTQSLPYWSSTTNSLVPKHAWMVIFNHGNVGSNAKKKEYLVRPVRGGL
jgi:hypothetical protein